MKDDFPFIEIPQEFLEIIGEPIEGTRTYRAYGTEDEMEYYFEVVSKICEPEGALSPGGVAGMAKVSRAAVHKRLKEGRLTGFLFNRIKISKNGRMSFVESRRPYCLIPYSESKAWAQEMKLRRGDEVEQGCSDRFMNPPFGWRKKIKQDKK